MNKSFRSKRGVSVSPNSVVGVKEVIVGGGFVSEIGTSTKWTVIIFVKLPS